MILYGIVSSGRREAGGFLSVPWVVDQLREKAGFVPYPGTLNLRITSASSLAHWDEVRRVGTGVRLRSPDPAFCDATCYPVLLDHRVSGAVVLPEVEGYPLDVVEVVAQEKLRDSLNLADGDEVAVTFMRSGL